VVTIHDLSPLEHPEWFRPAFAAGYRWLLPRLIRRARRVLTDSDFTRRRFIERGVPPAKISVIPPGVSPSFRPMPEAERERVRAKYALTARYALFHGSIEPRKNLPRLLQAWRLISASYPDHELAIAGSTGTAFAKIDLDGTPARTRWLGYVPDGDLPGLYSAADVFALVSIDEGFGLTALEAMACGTPLLLSRAGALSELAGESARYVDPLDVNDIANGLRALLQDERERSRLAEEGRERSLGFRWETAADSVWAILQEVAGG
jgi:glycosyltransferase involved in cell wall biosynthesis